MVGRSLIASALLVAARAVVLPDRAAERPRVLRPGSASAEVPVSHAVVAKSKEKRLEGNATKQAVTFEAWYNSHSVGRGIWKWNDALVAYQRHFTAMAGQPLKLVEIGVQSGGSIEMWQAVLGAQCHVYGIDINDGVNRFANPSTTITIGDQANVNMWWSFYAQTGNIDILVDDGGHESHQMLVTLQQSFDHLSPGGLIAIEDIHGSSYLEPFFIPSAQFLGSKATQGQLASVHVYPFLLIAAKAGNDQRAPLTFSGPSTTVSEFAQLWAAVAMPSNAGGHVILENAGWGPFLTEQGLSNFFRLFNAIHDGNWYDSPSGCRTTAAAVCSVTVNPSLVQTQITGIHIYPTRLVVEVANGPVTIQAVRKGTEWLPYGF